MSLHLLQWMTGEEGAEMEREGQRTREEQEQGQGMRGRRDSARISCWGDVRLRSAHIYISLYARHTGIMGEKDVGTGEIAGYSTPKIVEV